MNKQIDFQTDKSIKTSSYSAATKSGSDSSFQTFLTNSLDKTLNTKETTPVGTDLQTSATNLKQDSSGLVYVGSTTKTSPTVSHVLSNNDEFKQQSWDIIYSTINKEKPYTSIPLRASIYYDKQNGELSWSKGEMSQQPPKLHTAQEIATTSPVTTSQAVSLGKVNSEFPTVSHLLAASSELSAEKWNILSASTNSDKDFSKIPKNTEIWFNKYTKELSWQGSGSSSATASQSENKLVHLENQSQLSFHTKTPTANPYENNEITRNASGQGATPINTASESTTQLLKNTSSIAPDLTEAVKPFIGTPYNKIDCYGLVINGLKNMGLPYSGKGGLRNKLTSMAKQKGLPDNTYLTGEGIVKATGKQVFTHSSATISNWTKEADKIYQDMRQLLQKGQILSFSTPTRGHTGIISQHNDKWTFINSGRMDNHVAEANRSKEVGEEDLVNEVHNWFKLAKKNREPLLVTLGQIEKEKIRSTIQPNFQVSQRI